MDQHALELEGLFEDHGACSCTITNSLDLEHVVYEQRAVVQPPPTAQQLTRQRGVQFLLDLTVTCALPAQISEFALQFIDLAQIWSNGMTGTIEYDDLLTMAAAVFIFHQAALYTEKVPSLLT